MRVLIIDDEPASVEPLRAELKDRGFSPLICDFEASEDSLREFRPAAVVLDLLKGETEVAGDTTYGVIWDTRFCPIVIYSATHDIEIKTKALDLGAVEYLEMPLHTKDLDGNSSPMQ